VYTIVNLYGGRTCIKSFHGVELHNCTVVCASRRPSVCSDMMSGVKACIHALAVAAVLSDRRANDAQTQQTKRACSNCWFFCVHLTKYY